MKRVINGVPYDTTKAMKLGRKQINPEDCAGTYNTRMSTLYITSPGVYFQVSSGVDRPKTRIVPMTGKEVRDWMEDFQQRNYCPELNNTCNVLLAEAVTVVAELKKFVVTNLGYDPEKLLPSERDAVDAAVSEAVENWRYAEMQTTPPMVNTPLQRLLKAHFETLQAIEKFEEEAARYRKGKRRR
jgi:hypothetical protein